MRSGQVMSGHSLVDNLSWALLLEVVGHVKGIVENTSIYTTCKSKFHFSTYQCFLFIHLFFILFFLFVCLFFYLFIHLIYLFIHLFLI